ncbi:uncharacterized protein LOC108739590 isoform X2 [Agrilus planipennis]|uniref:Uncharacterized protein LOC108739590 isoform X2 n=1 Tax=Agrilus planipennis TaxID=224129 RepID=A0A1W4X9Q9_AGRPL|nr:uncharacterized protein LOC108739590 isoform X2 [Agrilus planipennis]
MSCLGECLDIGPPPDSIIFIPPPPVPDFLQSPLQDVVLNTTPCTVIPICEAWVQVQGGGKFSELPRKDVETWAASTIDDTWLLILVASSVVVLLLGALLAMFLLKCRDTDCTLHSRDIHQTKSPDQRECSGFNGTVSHKYLHPTEAVLYTGSPTMHDNRLVWAALTPRGTQHFISESYPKNLINYVENDVHYEAVDNLTAHPLQSPTYDDYQKGKLIRAVHIRDISNWE